MLISDMHQFFQQDLMRLRKKNALELVNCSEILKNKEFKIEVKVSAFHVALQVLVTLFLNHSVLLK